MLGVPQFVKELGGVLAAVNSENKPKHAPILRKPI
jgi:hypothetical protein